jgi:multidrug efflux pump subunit AcrA (membrane-fusion protein)
MKRKIVFVLVLVVMLTAACGSNSATPLPTVMLEGGSASTPEPQSNRGGIAASGFVVPAQEAQMAFTLGGVLQTVNIVEGQTVQAGDLLAELDNELIQLQVEQARRNVRELTSAAAVAAAAKDLVTAQKTLDEAQEDWDSLYFPRASDTLIENTEASIDLARNQLAIASDNYRRYSRLEDGNKQKAEAEVMLTNAQLRLDALITQLNWYTGTPTENDAALIQANLDTAKAAHQEAQWYLAAVKGESLPAEATGLKLAQLHQAQDAVKTAEINLRNTRLLAPISGTVVIVRAVAGEFVSPGEILFVISDVAKLRIETTDLSERDVPNVSVGQPVTVLIDALGIEVPGSVIAISPVADTLGGDIVYKTTIELESPPDGLRSGMSVEVRYEK